MNEERIVSVSVRQLDTEFRREQSDRPALLRIDVQGFGFETLQGAARALDAIEVGR
jgi:FkbM family methyltransferase